MSTSPQLCAYLKLNSTLSTSELEQICSCFKPFTLTSRHYLQQTDSVITNIAFVCEGILRAFTINEQGNECVHYFVTKNQFVTDFNGLIKHRKADINLQAIGKCKLLIIKVAQLKQLNQEIATLETLIHQLKDQELLKIQEIQTIRSEKDLYTRINLFNNYFKDILPYLPQNQTASFLLTSKSQFYRLRIKMSNLGSNETKY